MSSTDRWFELTTNLLARWQSQNDDYRKSVSDSAFQLSKELKFVSTCGLMIEPPRQ